MRYPTATYNMFIVWLFKTPKIISNKSVIAYRIDDITNKQFNGQTQKIYIDVYLGVRCSIHLVHYANELPERGPLKGAGGYKTPDAIQRWSFYSNCRGLAIIYFYWLNNDFLWTFSHQGGQLSLELRLYDRLIESGPKCCESLNIQEVWRTGFVQNR